MRQCTSCGLDCQKQHQWKCKPIHLLKLLINVHGASVGWGGDSGFRGGSAVSWVFGLSCGRVRAFVSGFGLSSGGIRAFVERILGFRREDFWLSWVGIRAFVWRGF